jgi:hypothetical protein
LTETSRVVMRGKSFAALVPTATRLPVLSTAASPSLSATSTRPGWTPGRRWRTAGLAVSVALGCALDLAICIALGRLLTL